MRPRLWSFTRLAWTLMVVAGMAAPSSTAFSSFSSPPASAVMER